MPNTLSGLALSSISSITSPLAFATIKFCDTTSFKDRLLPKLYLLRVPSEFLPPLIIVPISFSPIALKSASLKVSLFKIFTPSLIKQYLPLLLPVKFSTVRNMADFTSSEYPIIPAYPTAAPPFDAV